MRGILVILSFSVCFAAKGYPQSSFTSPITQHWPTIFSTEFEDSDRTIYIDSGSITLTTKTKEGKLIEVYNIKEIKRGGLTSDFYVRLETAKT